MSATLVMMLLLGVLLMGQALASVSTDEILLMLRLAGSAMLRLPGNSISLYLSSVALDYVDDPRLAYGYTPVEVNRTPPLSREISLMDFVFPWLSIIPDDKYVVRKIVAHRMLWDPVRERSIWSYRRLGAKMHTSHQAVKSWEEQGVEMIRKGVENKKALMDKIEDYVIGFTGAYGGYADGFRV